MDINYLPDYHWESMEIWVETKIKSSVTEILLRNLQKGSLTCKERGILKTHYPLWSMVKNFIL